MTIAACASAPKPTIIEYFDEETVTAVTRARKAALFVARQPDLSDESGDLVSMGPVYTILSAEHDQFLWLGFWTTLDRADRQPVLTKPPAMIIIEADGEAIELEADPQVPATGRKSRRMYLAPSPGVRDAYYRVTTEQLVKIANASDVRLLVHTAKKGQTVYLPQGDIGSMLRAFVDFVG